MMRFDYYRPGDVDEARRLRATIPGSRYVAGGTDVLVQIKSGLDRPTALISLRAIPGLAAIEPGKTTRIGALTPVNDILYHPVVRERYGVLAAAIERMAFEQIRNVATIGGNLCTASPCADTAPPLLVLDAKVRIRSAAGDRDLPLEELFVGPRETCLGEGDILTSILLPAPPSGARSLFLKRRRVHVDIGLANVALLLGMEGETPRVARVAAGAVAPVPLRLRRVESLVEGRPLTPEVLAEAQNLASESVSPISDLRASADYRRHIVGVYVRRGLEALLGRRPR